MIRLRRACSWLGLLALGALVAFQAYAFYFRLPLSLGPRVILQPWLQRLGYLPYEEIIDLHMPLMPLLLQGLSILGRSELQLAKLVVVGLLSLTTLLTYFFASRAFGQGLGLWAVVFLMIWAPFYSFGKLWHESFLAPAYLLYLFFLRPGEPARPTARAILLGLLGGGMILTKQHAVLPFLAVLLIEFLNGLVVRRAFWRVLREVFLIGIAAAIPLLLYAGYQFWHTGTLEGFIYWTFFYNLQGDYKSLSVQSPTSIQLSLLASCALLLPAAAAGLMHRIRKGCLAWYQPIAWFLLMGAACVTAYPRFGTFHLQPAVPFLALLSTFAISQLTSVPGASRWAGWGVALGLSCYWIFTVGAAYLPVFHPDQPRVIGEYSNLEPAALQLRQQMKTGETLFVFMDDESLSNLYYLAGRMPPRFWIFHYPWYMQATVKQRILKELAAAPPDWVVYSPKTWDARRYAPEIDDYILQHYQEQLKLDGNGGKLRLLRKKD
jgi:hypothetical protein